MKRTLPRGRSQGKSRPDAEIRARVAPLLLDWYDRHRRILPWRALPGRKPDPYHVWLSEIMLQQTTVAAVGPYYRAFLTRWPSVQDLAAASLEEIRKMWAGLGYYRRAKALHEGARKVCALSGGRFPETEAALRQLPGCGPYTAAAVAAIAFDQPASVVDGNVERVVARLFAVTEPLPAVRSGLRTLAASLLPGARFGDYAQALMDLGAMVCVPRAPRCGLCPLAALCAGRRAGIEAGLPRKQATAPKPLRRAWAFFLTRTDGRMLLRRRPEGGLLGGMMEVPTSAWREGRLPSLAQALDEAPARGAWEPLRGRVRHVFSHFVLEIAVAHAAAGRGGRGLWVSPDEAEAEALPSVMRKIVGHGLKALERKKGGSK